MTARLMAIEIRRAVTKECYMPTYSHIVLHHIQRHVSIPTTRRVDNVRQQVLMASRNRNRAQDSGGPRR